MGVRSPPETHHRPPALRAAGLTGRLSLGLVAGALGGFVVLEGGDHLRHGHDDLAGGEVELERLVRGDVELEERPQRDGLAPRLLARGPVGLAHGRNDTRLDPGMLIPCAHNPLTEVAQGLGQTATEPGIEPQGRDLVPTEPPQVGRLLLGASELAGPRHHQVAKIEVGMGRLARARRNLVHVDVERPRGVGMETGVFETRLLAHLAQGHRLAARLAGVGVPAGLEPSIELAMMEEEDAPAVRAQDEGASGQMALADAAIEGIGMPGHEVEDARDVARFRRVLGAMRAQAMDERLQAGRRHRRAQDPGRRSIRRSRWRMRAAVSAVLALSRSTFSWRCATSISALMLTSYSMSPRILSLATWRFWLSRTNTERMIASRETTMVRRP